MSRPRRLSAFEYIGLHRYFLTFLTQHRVRVFLDENIAAAVAAQFVRTATEWEFDILAHCLMPDHAHLLVEGVSERSDLKRFAKRLKQGSGQIYTRRRAGPLWQEGYYEHVLRGEEDSRAIARYILENPVRAGLVRAPTEYPHLGSMRWSLGDLLDSV